MSSPVKISDGVSGELNKFIQEQKNKSKLENDSGKNEETATSKESEESDKGHELKYLLKDSADADFKIYKFNGKLYDDESSLGRNFDVTL